MNPNGYSNVLKVEIAPGFVIEVNLDAYGLHVFGGVDIEVLDNCEDARLELYEVRLAFKPDFLSDRVTGFRRSPIRAALTDQKAVAGMLRLKIIEALHKAQKKYAEQ